MRILVTAGNTQAPIDRVRCITNVFTGRTGARIADAARSRGHHADLLTSVPGPDDAAYRTFDEFAEAFELRVREGDYDAIIHAAAVSDYRVAGVFSADRRDLTAGKIKSDESEVWLKLERVPKLVERIREPWGFRGVLVQFKLEVGIAEEEMVSIARRSLARTGGDLVIANTLETASESAWLCDAERAERVPRDELAGRILDAIERIFAGFGHPK